MHYFYSLNHEGFLWEIIKKLFFSESISLCVNIMYINVHVKLLQSCPTLCNCKDCSPPGSSVYGIFQTRILKWVAITYSGGSSYPEIKYMSLMSPALAGRFFTTRTTCSGVWKKMNTYLWLSLKKWLNVKKKYVHIILHMFWSTVRVRCKVIFKF